MESLLWRSVTPWLISAIMVGILSPEMMPVCASAPPESNVDPEAYIEDCIMKLTPNCSTQLFIRILDVYEAEIISEYCCEKLIAMGIDCNEALMSNTMETLTQYGFNNTDIRDRSVRTWNSCIFIVDKDIPLPLPYK